MCARMWAPLTASWRSVKTNALQNLRWEYGENRTNGIAFVPTLNGICPPTVSLGHAIHKDYEGPMLCKHMKLQHRGRLHLIAMPFGTAIAAC